MRTTKTLTRATRNTISRYGVELCLAAYRRHAHDGEGASTISYMFRAFGGNTRRADAAIDAGRELETGSR